MDAFDIQAILLISIFVIGYFLITIEHLIRIDKATIALLMGIACWVVHFVYGGNLCIYSQNCLKDHISSISQIIFFLLGALAIVAIINEHNGFSLIANAMTVRSKRKLLWIIGFLAFFLSAILDNLTTTIVMVTLLSGLIPRSEDRLIIGGGIVIAANAGGAWTPIGDVTTTMLWIGEQITSVAIMRDLFLPSIVCMIVSFGILSFFLKGDFDMKNIDRQNNALEPRGNLIFFLGIAALIFVPVFKILTGLPPFMGVLLGLGVLWLVTDILHRAHYDRQHLLVPKILTKVDLSGLLFFLGILLAIDALDSAGILERLAHWLDHHFNHPAYIAILIGLASAVVDNVPLVAATMGMYELTQYPPDNPFWQMIAFCAGTGGSILIIGSAAGIVFMGLEKVDFFWYVKKISLAALAGYFAGIATYLMLTPIN